MQFTINFQPVLDAIQSVGIMGVITPYLTATLAYGLRRARRNLLAEQDPTRKGEFSKAQLDDQAGLILRFMLTFLLAPGWVPGNWFWKAMSAGVRK